MERYRDFIQNKLLNNKISKLVEANIQMIETILFNYPEIPKDYIEFLSFIGFGSIGDSEYMIYEGPIKLLEIYENPQFKDEDLLNNIILIGDNFCGDLLGYDIRDWSLIELWHNSDEIIYIRQTFEDHVKELIK